MTYERISSKTTSFLRCLPAPFEKSRPCGPAPFRSASFASRFDFRGYGGTGERTERRDGGTAATRPMAARIGSPVTGPLRGQNESGKGALGKACAKANSGLLRPEHATPHGFHEPAAPSMPHTTWLRASRARAPPETQPQTRRACAIAQALHLSRPSTTLSIFPVLARLVSRSICMSPETLRDKCDSPDTCCVNRSVLF